jgi:hypothetical protein
LRVWGLVVISFVWKGIVMGGHYQSISPVIREKKKKRKKRDPGCGPWLFLLVFRAGGTESEGITLDDTFVKETFFFSFLFFWCQWYIIITFMYVFLFQLNRSVRYGSTSYNFWRCSWGVWNFMRVRESKKKNLFFNLEGNARQKLGRKKNCIMLP